MTKEDAMLFCWELGYREGFDEGAEITKKASKRNYPF